MPNVGPWERKSSVHMLKKIIDKYLVKAGYIIYIIWPEWQFFNVAGYLYAIEESRRSTVIYASPQGQSSK